MSNLFLGIDTSNYKTSVSIVDEDGSIVFNRSEFLEVKHGELGLRQSEAFFMHSNRLPEFINDAFSSIDSHDIEAIGVSTQPRRIQGSYMPCFLAGHNLAKELSAALAIPVYEYSHQEGHAAAAMINYPELYSNRSIFFHLSGGTTEFLICEPDNNGFNMEIAGGTRDISIGQLLDRIGVKLGLPFPSGKYLDEIAGSVILSNYADEKVKEIKRLVIRPQIGNCDFNLSGLETKLIRYIETNPAEDDIKLMTACLFDRISELLVNCADKLSVCSGIDRVMMAGGVASSKTIRKLITDKNHANNILFGAPELSGDNAVGVAVLTHNSYNTANRI